MKRCFPAEARRYPLWPPPGADPRFITNSTLQVPRGAIAWTGGVFRTGATLMAPCWPSPGPFSINCFRRSGVQAAAFS
jgi:hypothetical protein